jgi:hypothetical protein
MTSHPERELARLRARYQQRAQEVAELGFLMRGSILQRFSRCGTPGCGCHDEPPRLHGPYRQWTRKVKGKTVTRNLSEEQVSRYREWMENAKRLDEIIQELQDLSAQADQILRAQESPRAQPKPRTARGPSRTGS